MKARVVTFLVLIGLGAVLAGAGTVDPAGEWTITRSNSRTSGPCPMGSNGAGELTIDKSGGAFTLTYGKGMTCSPVEVCKLAGSASGGVYTFTTTVQVDEEGGKVTNSLKLSFDSASSANGKGSSKYVHPSGMTCLWTFDVALSR
jgi:hypothetical protein